MSDVNRCIRRCCWGVLGLAVAAVAAGAWLPDSFLFLLGLIVIITAAVVIESFC